MAAFNQFYNLVGRNFGALNTVVVALLPNKGGAASVSDYRPISLIHSIAKLISKVLSLRLASVIHT
uniref:Reverse transcriptase domain-containing protein n=1 Tax=Aegilops tauschii subsp. strangulata TaxID=200361 RepID=A0A453P487_AEGTS